MSIKSTAKQQFKLTDKQKLSEYITGLTWSPDGSLAIITAAGELAIWREGKLNLLTSLDGYSLDCLGFSDDGKYLGIGGQKGEVRLWQVAENDFDLVTTIDNQKAWIDSLAWHPQEHLLAFAVNRQIAIWDTDSQQAIANLDYAASSVFNLAWHPDGHLLAASGHGGVKVWNKKDWTEKPFLLQVPGASLDCAWSSDGTYLASGNLDRTISLLHWNNPPPWLMQGFPGKVSQVQWSEIQPLLAAVCQNAIVIWQFNDQTNNWESYVLEKHQKFIQAIAFAPQSLLLASAASDGYIYLWQKAKKIIQSFKTSGEFTCLAWHPTGKYLAAGGGNGEVIIWSKSDSGRGFGH